MVKEIMSERANVLYSLMMLCPFDPAKFREELERGDYTADDINAAAYSYVDDCFLDLLDEEKTDEYGHYKYHRAGRGVTVPGFPSSHIHQVLQILLDFGLEPNKIFEDCTEDGYVCEEYNIMYALHRIDNGYEAADSLELLLSHGGNPNLKTDGETLLEELYFDLVYGMFGQLDRLRYDSFLHYIFVLAGYGAAFNDGKKPLELFHSFELNSLRDHRKFDWTIIHSSNSEDGWEISIFDREFGIEVARA